ncbi:MAG: VOC family protein [Micrococcales bacterium]|nr:VOC family protein [Micrococcales bacterium]
MGALLSKHAAAVPCRPVVLDAHAVVGQGWQEDDRSMSLDVFVNFDGQCRDAVAFYAGVFDTSVASLMTYADNPQTDVVAPQDRDRVLYAAVPVGGHTVMFSDCPYDPTGARYVPGNNIALTFGSADPDEIAEVYGRLADGGQVLMPLGRTFFSEHYAMVRDRFGIIWQLSHAPGDVP